MTWEFRLPVLAHRGVGPRRVVRPFPNSFRQACVSCRHVKLPKLPNQSLDWSACSPILSAPSLEQTVVKVNFGAVSVRSLCRHQPKTKRFLCLVSLILSFVHKEQNALFLYLFLSRGLKIRVTMKVKTMKEATTRERRGVLELSEEDISTVNRVLLAVKYPKGAKYWRWLRFFRSVEAEL